MIKCVKHGIEGPEVYARTIETIRESGNDAHKMATIWHIKKTFTTNDDKRYQTQNYHSLAYGHYEAKGLFQ